MSKPMPVDYANAIAMSANISASDVIPEMPLSLCIYTVYIIAHL